MADAQLRLDDDTKAAGLRTTDELQQLVAEHHELDERIHRLSTLSYLTDQQQFEEVQLKKRKLALKDRIEGLLRGGQRAAAVPRVLRVIRRCRGTDARAGRSSPWRDGILPVVRPFVSDRPSRISVRRASPPIPSAVALGFGHAGSCRRRCSSCPWPSRSSFAIPIDASPADPSTRCWRRPTAPSCTPATARPDEAPPGAWQQVTIFLSVLDVHINRTPVSGVVTRVDYQPGTFLPAYRREAHKNERSEIWIDHRRHAGRDAASGRHSGSPRRLPRESRGYARGR